MIEGREREGKELKREEKREIYRERERGEREWERGIKEWLDIWSAEHHKSTTHHF